MVLIKIFQRNNKAFKLFLILFFLFEALSIKAQVYPVQINGSMIGPNSLNLSDYSSLKSQDLMFFITLSDPVEATRMVKLKFSIVNNGQEVIMTSPNYNPIPITLEKDVTVMLDGNDLAGYLNEFNLVGLENQQAGGLIPEGYNGFCLEIIDVERNVVISDKFCSYGYFELSDPPILNTPICDEQIMWSESQNIMFNWLPQHFSSANSPMSVEYQFKLVELLPEQTPNDAFQFSIPLYETTTFSTSLFYLEDAPLLEPGKVYAWSVRAVDSQGLNLFNNNGYSQICTFSIMEDNEDETSVPEGSCENGLCDWSGDLSIFPLTSGLSPGDKVDVGFFSMVITEITNASDFYEGTGTIYLPFLHSKLKVSFSNLQINEDQRVFAGDIFSESPENELLIPDLFSIQNSSSYTDPAINLATSFTDQTALALDQYFNDPSSNLVSTLAGIPEQSAIPITVPIGMDLSSENIPGSFRVAVTGLKFTANSATLNAVMSTRLEENSPWIKFGAKDFCIQPQGLAQSGISKLNLLSNFDLDFNGMPVTFLVATPASEGSYVSWNCDGFEEFNLKGEYEFEDDFKNLTNLGESIVATFSASTIDLDDIMAVLDPIDRFSINGADDFEFEISDVIVDLSSKRNDNNLVWPDDPLYQNADSTWMGLYVNAINLTLPIALQFGKSANSTIEGRNLLIDNNGASGSIQVNEAFRVDKNAFGKWRFSVDEISVNFLSSQFVEASIDGSVNIPLAKNKIEYIGSITYDQTYRVKLGLKNDVVTTLEGGPTNAAREALAAFTIYKEYGGRFTQITADYNPSEYTFQPNASICGNISMLIDETILENSGIDATTISTIKNAVKTVSTLPDPLSFGANFNICLSMNSDRNGFMSYTLEGYNGSLSFGDFDMDINNTLSLFEMEFYMNDNDGDGILNISSFMMPGFYGYDYSEFPIISFQSYTGIPDLQMPDFPNLNIQNTEEFDRIKSLGFQFNMPAIPGFSIKLGLWSYATRPFSNFDFAAFVFDIESGAFICGPCSDCPALTYVEPTDTDNGKVNILNVDVEFTEADYSVENEKKVISLKKSLKEEIQESGVFNLPEGFIYFDMILEELTFEDGSSKASIIAEFKPPSGGLLKLRADSIGIFSGGLYINDVKFYLENNVNVSYYDILPTDSYTGTSQIRLLGGRDSSYVIFDCGGIAEFHLAAEYDLPSKFSPIASSDDNKVTASLMLQGSDWNDIIGTANIEPFTIKGVDDFVFNVTDAVIDLSEKSNPDIVWPDNESYNIMNVGWTGFYIEELSLTLPEALSFTDDGSQTEIIGHDLLIDDLGFSGLVGINGFMNTGTDDFGGWELTIDSIGVSFTKSKFDFANIDGTITLPLLDEAIDYVGALTYEDPDNRPYTKNSRYEAVLGLKENVASSLSIGPDGASNTLAKITLFKENTNPTLSGNTEVRAFYNELKDSFEVSAMICGGVDINIDRQSFLDTGIPLEIVEALEGEIDASLSFHAGFDMCLDIDPSGLRFDGSYFDLQVGTINLSLGDLSVDLDNILNLMEMDFTMPVLGGGLPTINMPGFPSINVDSFPNITFPGFPNMPEVKMPDFPHFNDPDFPNLPSINLPELFFPLGFNFDFNLSAFGLPSLDIGLGLWAYTPLPIEGIPDFDFASFEIKVPSFFFDCIRDLEPLSLSGDNELKINFLSETFIVDEQIVGTTTAYKISDANDGFFENMTVDKLMTNYMPSELQFQLPEDYNMAITGISYETSDNSAALTAELVLDGFTFGGSLPIDGKGVVIDGAKIALLSDISMEDMGLPGNLPITILGGMDKSYVTLSCNGIQNFHLTGEYKLPYPTYIKADGGTVTVTMSLEGSQWKNFIGKASFDSKFKVSLLDGFEFEVGTAVVDLDTTGNDANQLFPLGYGQDDSWRGFYLDTLSLTLPEELSFTDDDSSTTFEGNNLLIDIDGVSGELQGTNVFSVSKDAFGGWDFSIDTIGVEFLKNDFVEARVNGDITIPLVDDKIGYEGFINYEDPDEVVNSQDEFYRATLGLKKDVVASLGAGPTDENGNALATFTIYKKYGDSFTEIRADYNPNENTFEPNASICGSITMLVDETTLVNSGVSPTTIADVKNAVKTITDLPGSLSLGANFTMCLSIDPSRLNMFSLDSYAGTLSLGGYSMDMGDLNMLEMNFDMSTPSVPSLSLPEFPNFNIDMDLFPIVALPQLSGFPDLPNITMPDFPNFKTDFPSIDLPTLFMPFGLHFNIHSIPGFNIEMGLWSFADLTTDFPETPKLPKFEFAAFEFNIEPAAFICGPCSDCQSLSYDEPAGTINGNVNILNVNVGFDQNAFSNDGNEQIITLNKSLKDEIEKLGGFKLPEELADFDMKLEKLTFKDGVSKASIIAEFKLPGSSEILRLKTDDIGIFPGGMNINEVKFYLENTSVELSDLGLPGELPLRLVGGGGQDSSYVIFNCAGFAEFHLAAECDLPRMFDPVDSSNGDKVTVSMSLQGSDWNDIIAEATIEPFTIDGVDGFEFTVNNAVADLSKKNNPEIVWPDDQSYDAMDETWKGFYLEKLSVKLPEALSFGDGQAEITGRNLLIDDLGFSGNAGFNNFLTSSTDDFGGWELTIDSIGVSFTKSELDSAYMDGSISIPLLEDEIEYMGNLKYQDIDKGDNTDYNQYVATLGLKEDITVGLSVGSQSGNPSLAKMSLFKEIESINGATEIRAVYDEAEDNFTISATICGGVSIDITEQSFVDGGVPPEVIDLMQKAVGDDISFNANFDMCLNIDPSGPSIGSPYFDLNAGTVSMSLGDMSVNLDDILNLMEMKFTMPINGVGLPTITMPGIPNIVVSGFPNVSFPDMPDMPEIQMPDFPNLSGINLPDPFLPLGFNFDFNLSDISPGWPSINVGLGLWAYTPFPIEGIPDFDFASIELKMPKVSFSCLIVDPNLYVLGDNPSSIRVDFLDHIFPIKPVAGSNPQSFKYDADAGDTFFDGLNLRSALDAMLTSAPFEQVIGEIGTNFELPVDISVTGLTFYKEDGIATLNTALTITIDGSTYSFAATIPIDKDGFYIDGIKIGYVGETQN